ncbi:hypothetical protein M8J76_011519 [Diaphorina citri]|nr:hypothetical protein M8J75_004738 [Diaphorina citri]KAI5745498.1 hypothetical protein M8J76_011519 [Diaphorina citri]KAI5751839.1 hypothetical protein M8J77_011297 [Diaphorina citri]
MCGLHSPTSPPHLPTSTTFIFLVFHLLPSSPFPIFTAFISHLPSPSCPIFHLFYDCRSCAGSILLHPLISSPIFQLPSSSTALSSHVPSPSSSIFHLPHLPPFIFLMSHLPPPSPPMFYVCRGCADGVGSVWVGEK